MRVYLLEKFLKVSLELERYKKTFEIRIISSNDI